MNVAQISTLVTGAADGTANPAGGTPTTTTTTDDSGGSGCGCTGMVLGCGCLSLVLMMVAGMIGSGVVFWQAPRAVGADDWGEVVALVDSATDAAGGAGLAMGDGGFAGEDLGALQGSADDEAGASTGIDQFFEVLAVPTSRSDMRRYQSEMAQWEQSQAVRDFQDVLNQAEELQEREESMMNIFPAFRLFSQFAFRSNDLGEAYANHGDGDFHHLHSRVLAIARSSMLAAENAGHEPWEQAVADALLEDHDENREQFEETRAMIEQATSDEAFDADALSDEEQMELMTAMTNQFLLITSAINRESLETWAALSDGEREEILEQTVEPHNYIARTLAPVHAEPGDDVYFFPFFGL